jgi:TonB family protein
MWRPDPLERAGPADDPSSSQAREPEWIEEGAPLYLAELAATLASHGGGSASADLALDLVLNEIVEQARLATTATGAAIAMARDGEMVCRATTGENAPDLGVRLNTRSVLSGACLRTKEVQRCDDTENDPRVDPAACRHLDVRSILVVPVLNGEELIGVFEIFSPRPNAFSDRDVQTVQALSRRIVANINGAAEAAAPAPVVTDPLEPATSPVADVKSPDFPLVSEDAVTGLVPLVANADGQQAEPAKAEIELQPKLRQAPELQGRAAHRDYLTSILTAIVIGLALLLGWMVGRASWMTAIGLSKTQSTVAPPVQRSESTSQPNPAPKADAESTQATSEKKPVSPALTRLKTKPTTDAASAGGLVVYENGKVVFRMTPSQRSPQGGTALGAEKRSEDTPVKGNESPTVAASVTVSPEIASEYLAQRVEPQYPEQAREQHIQGPVVLHVLVGKDGVVREVKVISGASMLGAAAVDAVRQWRFRPYPANSQPVDFDTQVTVDFTLP